MGRRVLLVEGTDDFHAMMALCQHHKIPEKFTIEKAGGVEDLLALIHVRPKGSDIERLAVVIDADVDLVARWTQVRGRALQAGYRDVPAAPLEGGTIVTAADLPSLGLWVMPDNRIPGILEDFLAFLVPVDDRVLPHVDSFLDVIPESTRRYPSVRRPKARIHAWLSVQQEPGKPLGQAITARYLDADREVTAPFLAWLRAALVD